MLAPRLYREYRIKSYLNMNHYIVINGKNGETHPHTWEFVFTIVTRVDEFVQFSTFERVIEAFLDIYQNKVMNEIDPFTVINPTVENVSEYFANELRNQLREKGGQLVSLEGSETPTRAYILNFEKDEKFIDEFEEIKSERLSNIVDQIVDQIADNTAKGDVKPGFQGFVWR